MTANRNVQRLKAAVNIVLNTQEQVQFAQIINDYFTTGSISDMMRSLDQLLDTPAKRQLIGKLRKLIPRSHLSTYGRLLGRNSHRNDALVKDGLVDEVFDSWCQTGKLGRFNGSTVDVSPPHRKARSLPGLKSPTTVDQFPSPDLPNWKTGLINPVHRVRIERSKSDSDRELGLGIRGGAELGLGIYVSSVDVDSPADRHGLMPGNQIIAVNGISFKHISNSEAVKILSSARRLDFEVCHVGRIPGSYETHQEYTWVDKHGRTTSPPPELEMSSRYKASEERKSGLMLLKGINERKVNLSLGASRAMGLMIRGGKEFGLGIYVSGIDPGSSADYAGLKIGDQILDVNGISFLDISHADAVITLKSSRRLMLTVKDVGKIPHAMTTYDQTEWIRGENLPQSSGSYRSSKNSAWSLTLDKYGNSETSMFTRGLGSQLMLNTVSGFASQMAALERKAEQLLTKKELIKLRHCLFQYQNTDVSVNDLLAGLYQLFDTKAKLLLMTQIRGLIAPRDLDDFDAMTIQPNGELLMDEFLADSSASSITSGSHCFHSSSSSSQRKVADEMEPLRRAIKEIYEFDGNNFTERETEIYGDDNFLAPVHVGIEEEKSPWAQLSALQLHQKPSSRSRIQSSPPQLKTAAAVKDNHNGNFTETLGWMNKAVAMDTENNGSADDVESWKINSAGIKNDKRSTEGDDEILGVLPYYAQVHLRAVKHEDLNNSSDAFVQAAFARDGVRNDVGRKLQSQPLKPRQKLRGGLSSGSKSSQPTLDTVYELHCFNASSVGDELKYNDEEDSGRFVDRKCDTKEATRSQNLALEVAQIKGMTTEERHWNTANTSLIKEQQRYHRTAKENSVHIQHRANGNMSVLEPAVIYAYLHDSDNLSDDVADTSTELTDYAHSPLSSKSSQMLDSGVTSISTTKTESVSPDRDHFEESLEETDDASWSMDPVEATTAKAAVAELQAIKVYKTKAVLGIAVEGGADTRQPIPRIAKIQENGSAYGSDLEEGQLLVAVDGLSLFGLTHEECAALIAKSFKNKSKAYVDLVVLDNNRHLVV